MFDNSHSLVIEKMRKEDLDQVMEIEERSFSDPWNKSFFSQDIDNESALPLVVKEGDKVVGYVCLWKILDEIQISNIAVSPESRRRGLAQRMMKSVLETAERENCIRITLDVRISNQAAINLHRG